MRVFARDCVSYEVARGRKVLIENQLHCYFSMDSLDIFVEGVDLLDGELGTIGDLGKAQESMEHIVFNLVTESF